MIDLSNEIIPLSEQKEMVSIPYAFEELSRFKEFKEKKKRGLRYVFIGSKSHFKVFSIQIGSWSLNNPPVSAMNKIPLVEQDWRSKRELLRISRNSMQCFGLLNSLRERHGPRNFLYSTGRLGTWMFDGRVCCVSVR